MPRSGESLEMKEDLELSDAPPIDDVKDKAEDDEGDNANNDVPPEDDSDDAGGEVVTTPQSSSSNGSTPPEETKKVKLEEMFDDDKDEYGMNDEEDAKLFAATEAVIEYEGPQSA